MQIIEKSDRTLTYQAFIPSFVVKEEELIRAPEEYKKRRDLLISKLIAVLSLIAYLFANEKRLEDKIYVKVPKIREKISSKLKYNEIEWDPEPWRIEVAKKIIEEHKKKYGEELRSFRVFIDKKALGIDNETKLDNDAWIGFESYLEEHKLETNSYDIAEKTRSERLAEAYAKMVKILTGEDIKVNEDLKKEALLRGDSLIVELTDKVELTLEDIKKVVSYLIIGSYAMSKASEKLSIAGEQLGKHTMSHIALVNRIEEGLREFTKAVNEYNKTIRDLKKEVWFWRILVIINWIITIILIILRVI